MSQGPLKTLGIVNDDWGVCGFTSTFYAMYHANPATRPLLVNATEAYSVLYEIRDYLVALQSVNSPLLKDITDFTKSFGPPHDQFTVERYISRIDSSSAKEKEDVEILQNEKFGIGMPPQAVADYITRVWKWQATITEFGAQQVAGDAILGVTRGAKDKPYHGLCHYVYRGAGKIYSWGKEFSSLAAANAAYSICYTIDIRRY